MSRGKFGSITPSPVSASWPAGGLISAWDQSATRTDTAVLFAALFLQRFGLPFRGTVLHLDLVAIGSILCYQFFRGNLLIRYDRLLWFLPFVLVSTSSLLLNPKSSTTAYLLFVVFFGLFMLGRPSSPGQYKRTLEAFLLLVMVLSCLAVVQFFAQFVLDPYKMINFFGIFPDTLLSGASYVGGAAGNGLIRSNGIFMGEPAGLSEITALGILIEVMEFGRPKYLLVMALGFLMSYSGTGSLFLIVFLPLAALRKGNAALSALLLGIFALGLFTTGVVDPAAFTSRASEFETPGTSGYARFVSPFLLAAKQFETGSLRELLFGSGPGTISAFSSAWVNIWYSGGFAATWIKYLYEYGVIGSFVFCCFLASCLRKSRCPGLVTVAIILTWVFIQGSTTILIPLCTLNVLDRRRRAIDTAVPPSPVQAAGSVSG